MIRSITIALGLALVATSTASAVQIHKCTDAQGRVTFSQQQCEGATEQTIDIKTLPSTGAGQAAVGTSPDYEAVTRRVADRMTNVKIRNAENRIAALAKERDDKIHGYRVEMTRSANTIAGLNRNDQLRQLIAATRESYNSRIAAKRIEIRELRSQLNN